MPNSDNFLVVAKTLVEKDQNSCSVYIYMYVCMYKTGTNYLLPNQLKISQQEQNIRPISNLA